MLKPKQAGCIEIVRESSVATRRCAKRLASKRIRREKPDLYAMPAVEVARVDVPLTAVTFEDRATVDGYYAIA